MITGVNTLFSGLLHTPGFEKLDFSALKVVVGGGAAVQKPVAERWREVTGLTSPKPTDSPKPRPAFAACRLAPLGRYDRPTGFFN